MKKISGDNSSQAPYANFSRLQEGSVAPFPIDAKFFPSNADFYSVSVGTTQGQTL